MTAHTAPAFICDHIDGCDQWSIDYEAMTVSTVGTVRITVEHPAPGWTRVGDEHYCDEHAPGGAQ